MTLHMLHLALRPRQLLTCGREHRLVGETWSVETGYLVHALLARLFGEDAPAPFDLPDDAADSGNALLHVLAYGQHDMTTLTARAQARGDASALDAIAWAACASKPVPDFPPGHQLGFRVRLCPALRMGKHHPRFQCGAEIDPFLALVERTLAMRMVATPGTDPKALKREVLADLPSREAVYRDWFSGRLGPAARLEHARLVSLRDARLWRRGKPAADGPAGRMHGHARPNHSDRSLIGRRAAVFEGILRVEDTDAFGTLLARGVGRHRAFGFGMLLLHPVAAG